MYLFLVVLDYKWPSTFVWWETTVWSSPLLLYYIIFTPSFLWSTAALYKTPSYFICKHPAAHVSSPSLFSLLILNQQKLFCTVMFFSAPLDRSLVVICPWLCPALSLILINAVSSRPGDAEVCGGRLRCSLSPLTLDFTCPERHLQITGLCKIPQKLSLVTFDLTHCKFPVSLCGRLTDGCVFIDCGVLSCRWEGRLQRSSGVYITCSVCFLRSDLWTHKSLWVGIPMVTLVKWLIVGLKAYPLYRLSELFVIQLVSLKGEQCFRIVLRSVWRTASSFRYSTYNTRRITLDSFCEFLQLWVFFLFCALLN